MALAQEIRDFLSAYNTVEGFKDRAAARDDAGLSRKIKEAQYADMTDPAQKDLDRRYKEAQIGALTRKQAVDPADTRYKNARAAYWESRAAGGGEEDSAFEDSMSELDGGEAPSALPSEDAGAVDWITEREAGGAAGAGAVDTGEGAAAPSQYAPDPQKTPAQEAIDENFPVEGLSSANKAVEEGALYFAEKAGGGKAKAVDDGSAAPETREYLKGKGAAPASLMDQVYKVIDPKGEMPEAERNMRAYGAIWDYYNSRGEPEKAKAAAFAMNQYYRTISQRYAAISRAAAEAGDVDGAVKAAVRAYANIPDGRDLKIVKDEQTGKYAFELTDLESGKTIQKGIATPQEIGAMAMRVSPADFDNFIIEAAGSRSEGGGKKKLPAIDPKKIAKMKKDQRDAYFKTRGAMEKEMEGDKPPSIESRKSVNDDIGTAFGTFTDAQPAEAKAALDKDGSTFRSTSAAIYHANPSVSPEDAVSASIAITAVDPANPDATSFKVAIEGDGARVKFQNGLELTIPKNAFERLAAIRGRQIQAAKKMAAEAAQKAEDNKRAVAAGERTAQRVDAQRQSQLTAPNQGVRSALPDVFTGGPVPQRPVLGSP